MIEIIDIGVRYLYNKKHTIIVGNWGGCCMKPDEQRDGMD